MLDAALIDQTHGHPSNRSPHVPLMGPKLSGRHLDTAEANARKPVLVETPSADFRDGCNICNF